MVARPNAIRQSPEEAVVQEILQAIRTIKHGSIQLVIQDGKLIQIDKTEKLRLPRDSAG